MFCPIKNDQSNPKGNLCLAGWGRHFSFQRKHSLRDSILSFVKQHLRKQVLGYECEYFLMVLPFLQRASCCEKVARKQEKQDVRFLFLEIATQHRAILSHFSLLPANTLYIAIAFIGWAKGGILRSVQWPVWPPPGTRIATKNATLFPPPPQLSPFLEKIP